MIKKSLLLIGLLAIISSLVVGVNTNVKAQVTPAMLEGQAWVLAQALIDWGNSNGGAVFLSNQIFDSSHRTAFPVPDTSFVTVTTSSLSFRSSSGVTTASIINGGISCMTIRSTKQTTVGGVGCSVACSYIAPDGTIKNLGYPTYPEYCNPPSPSDQATSTPTVTCNSSALCEKDANNNNTGKLCSIRTCDDGTSKSFCTITNTNYCPPPKPVFIVLDPAYFFFSGTMGNPPTVGPDGNGRINDVLTVKNTGSADLNWAAQTDASWCKVDGIGDPGQDVGIASAAAASSSLKVSVDPLTAIGTHICTITVSDQSGVSDPQYASVVDTISPPVFPPTNTVSLSANKTSGPNPLGGVILTAVPGGNATGTLNYTFWWNCSSTATTVSAATQSCGDPSNPAIGEKHNNEPPTSVQLQTAGHTYSPTGNYAPKVIVERGSAAPAQGQTSIVVTAPPTPQSHSECVSNACASVSGAGANRCTMNADCPGSGGGSPAHGVCDAKQQACVNKAGAGASTCGTDPACGGNGSSHLTCQNNTCVIVGGSGSNQCATIGSACASNPGPSSPTCTFSASPNHVVPPAQATLSWSCSNVASCTINGSQLLNPNNGTMRVSPTQTTSYVLNCLGSGGAGSFSGSVNITVGGPGIREINL